jgi:hypothetical protein
MSKKDKEAAEAVHGILYGYGQYAYTLGIYDALKIVQAVDKVRKRQAVKEESR